MLELHRNALTSTTINPTIELKAADVQRFVLNDWSWMNKFLRINAQYSQKSMTIAKDLGIL